MPRFTHLHTHSHYSLLDGLTQIGDLVKRAKELGMDSLAVTDHGNLYGAIEFYKAAKAAGIKPILGVEAYIMPNTNPSTSSGQAERYYHLIILCKNLTGWKNLLKLITHANLEGFYYKPRINKDFLRKHSEGLIALSACLAGEVSKAIMANKMPEAEKIALEYQDIFGVGNFYLEVGHHPGIKETIKAGAGLIEISKKTGIPLAATQDIHYLKKEDAKYHDILLAVQTGNKLNDPDRLTLKDDDFSMRSPEEMASFFTHIPEAIENTAKIADQCNIELELGKIQLPKFDVPDSKSAQDYLKQLIEERTSKRYSDLTENVKQRIDYELGVVDKMGFADYFLIVQDFINWAKDRGIVVGPGRGSAAGSIVAYILGITDVDPIKYELLFERFLNPDRIQMPDIDIDIADHRRGEVLAYLVSKYGEDRVAHIITFGTMAARASIRDVGRALDISLAFCDQLAKLIPFNQDLEEALKSTSELATLYRTNPDAQRIIDAAKKLEGVARHASMHACGIVISNEPLINQLPLQRAPQDENSILTQFEMHTVEDLGLLKMDLLGLKNLTIIENALALIKENHGVDIDIHKLPEWDQKTAKLLQIADTTGVFQFESSGMRRYMKEIKPTELEDLIALVALYRPGPMDLIPDYIQVKHGLKQVKYLHPKLEPILKPTYGVGIYQEQMMRIARDLAGFTLAEADTLRKAIGKKIKELLDKQEEKLTKGMIANGIEPATAKAIWELFPPFARYGFNRSHAACYALIGYQTAYLKANYPVELMTAVLNADSGDTDRISFLITECQKMGIQILSPDINKSSASFTPEDKNIRFGLAAIKNVGENIVNLLIGERQRGGPFPDLVTILQRVQNRDLNKKSLESLAKCGVFDSLGLERNQIVANLEDIVKFSSLLKKSGQSTQMGLFGNTVSSKSLKLNSATPAGTQERLLWEKELLGLYLSDHPLNSYKEKFRSAGIRDIKDVMTTANPAMPNTMYKIGGLVSKVQKIVTRLGQPMVFVKLEDMNTTLEVVVFSDTLAKNPNIWQENKVLVVSGKMSWRNGEQKLIVNSATEV